MTLAMDFFNKRGIFSLLLFLLQIFFSTINSQFVISTENHHAEYLSCFSVARDKVLPFKLAETTGKLKKTTLVTDKFQYKSFSVKNKIDYLESYEIGGLAELNIAAALVSGSGSASFGYSDSLRFSSETIISIIRLSYRTKTETINVCNREFVLQVFDDILTPEFDAADYVVTGKRYGLQLDVIITASASSSSSSKKTEAQLEASVRSIITSLNAKGSLEKSLGSEISQEEVTIEVQSNHVKVPFPNPLSLSEIPSYLSNVTEWINTNGSVGGILEYVLEDLKDIRFCLTGRQSVAGTDFSEADLVARKVKKVLRKLDETHVDNVEAVKWVRQVQQCFTLQEFGSLEARITGAEDELFAGRVEMSSAIASYKNGKLPAADVMSIANTVYQKAVNGSVRSTLTMEQIQYVDFFSNLYSYNVTCLQRGRNAYLSHAKDKNEISYLLFNSTVLAHLLNTDIPMTYAKKCQEQRRLCKVLNCDMGFSVCASYTLPVLVDRSDLIPTESKYLDLAKASFDYLFNATRELDTRLNSFYTYLTQFHYDVQKTSLLSSINIKNYWGPRYKSIFAEGGNLFLNPINKLHELERP